MISKKDRIMVAITVSLIAGLVTFGYPTIFKIAGDIAKECNNVKNEIKGEQNNG